ncbi:MAG: S8 family serine peptidase, partial [Cyanobacteria bacterium P01_A01_bin.135]
DADETWSFSGNVRDDFFRNVPDRSYGSKSSSHGTEVQGIIAAESNNGKGISGINWESDVVAIDVLDGNRGDQTPTVATANMINHARSLGKKLVINMSFGGSGPIDPQLERLIASSQGDALFVIAAGNDGRGSLSNPASLAAKYSNVVAVGASLGTRTGSGWPVAPGTKASYSNYGHGISLTAPSEVITTGASPRGFGYSPKFNGTSAAAPHVAGVASLVWSVNDKLSAGTVKQVLMQTATDLGARGYDRVYGSGIVNADAAVRRAMAMS